MNRSNLVLALMIGLTLAVVMLSSVGIYRLTERVYNQFFSWKPESSTPPLIFTGTARNKDGSPVQLFTLTPEGIACQNLPELFKAWEAQTKTKPDKK